jgi:hypothetical protein
MAASLFGKELPINVLALQFVKRPRCDIAAAAG